MQKLMLPIGAAVVAVILAAAGWLALRPSDGIEISPAMMAVDGADIGGPFELTAHTGERMTSDALIDRPTLIYFGYTFCPDVCPIDSQIMVDAVDLLAERQIEVKPVFITIDPERDTPKELGYYAEAMHPTMVGLTGSPEDVRAAADEYKVFYKRTNVPGSAAEYLMQHTSFTYLMLPETGLAAIFRRDFPATQIADDIERVLAARSAQND